MKEKKLEAAQRRLPTVIDTLSAAFASLGRAPWLLLPPLLLNLLIWWLPSLQLSTDLATRLLEPLELFLAQMPTEGTAAIAEYYKLLTSELTTINLWSAATWPIFFWPTLILGHGDGPAVALQRNGQLVGMATALAFVGALLNMAWLALVAGVVQGRPRAFARLLRDGVSALLRIIGLFLLLAFIFLAIMTPLLIGASFLVLIVPALGALLNGVLFLLATWAGIWIAIHLYFVLGAILLDDMGILESTRHSILLVRQNFWSALGLIALSWVLSNGFWLIWLQLSQTTVGQLVAMGGSAALGTALAAAMMIYYRDRVPSVKAALVAAKKLAKEAV
ncbi:MAG: hypothetical protein KDD73_07340 [Anaerolineales bacterium]|nr:hypothetical protein [Anaerolineales bacterium]MCB9127476.1 hypothetical protein [Ardenticatenales bacterium]MCB9172191.1 hypothetical protein [Ardenticatenales bacterium]